MRTLGNVTPTPEQLTVIDDNSPGFWLIRGAAGSGKTTTALLRLRFLVRYWAERRATLDIPGPLRVLVLTFNRTLRGYVNELANQQIDAAQGSDVVHLEVSTFSGWARRLVDRVVLESDPRDTHLQQLAGSRFPWGGGFLASEVDYVLGYLLPDQLDRYLDIDRTGRGRPGIERAQRARLLDEVIRPYVTWKAGHGVVDWNDLAVELALRRHATPYDIVVIDEAQDFSANQVRAVVRHLADDFVCTFIRDSTQRIYPNIFTWREVGITVAAHQSRRLEVNHRNTRQIAAFARPLVEGIEATEDASLPDFTGCDRDGAMPVVLRGNGIHEVLHFTTDPGLLGTIRKGELQSRERVQDDPDLAFIFQPVWPPKALAWIDYISLSLGRINRTLYDRAVSNLKERWWGVLAFNLEILDHGDVWFATTNNAYETVCRRAQGVAGFEALFGPRIPWGHHGSVYERPGDAPRNRTTDPQAEVLYPGAIPLDHLKAVYVGDAQHRDLAAPAALSQRPLEDRYEELAARLGGLDPRSRGAGHVSAVLALWLAWVARDSPHRGVIAAATLQGSDTDTVASMAGALLGPLTHQAPPGILQDLPLLESEALRLWRIGQRQPVEDFAHPDPLRWEPPATQSDVVGIVDDAFVVAGLGSATPMSDLLQGRAADVGWQWLRLDYGQTILAKRRVEPPTLPERSLPRARPSASHRRPTR